MKRVIALLLAALLFTGAWTTAALGAPGDEPDEKYDELVVANPTPMDGKFFTEMWGNSTTDIDVRSLVNSYYLTVWDYEMGLFTKNDVVVSGMEMYDDENGDRTYEMVLYDDLYFSDGTQITAWDYAFSVLFQASPVIVELGGVPMEFRFLKGYEEYFRGEADCLSGLRVINDRIIQFTVRHEYLPFFFELHRLGFVPYPIHEIAPGCKVYDEGNGAFIGNEDPSVTEQIFTRELLEATVMDPDTGYLAHPTVGCGPYVLTSWDGKDATFEINPWFKGDAQGHLPTIPHIRFTLGDNNTMVDLLREDKFQLLNKVTRQDAILQGNYLVRSGAAYSSTFYPRIGLTFFFFRPDGPAFQEKNVRKAFAYCLDREPLVQDYTAGYGLGMDGLMGLGQWMYSLVNGTLPFPVKEPDEGASPAEWEAYEEEIAEWEELSLDGLTRYPLDVERAIELLEENGWVLNEHGEPYDPERDAFRCKEIDGELVKLDLTCAYPETNYGADSMEINLIPHLAEAGIRMKLVPLPMKTLFRSYNDREVETFDVIYLGDDFNIEFDPQLFFLEGDPEAPEEDNLTWVHAQIHEYCRLMCETEPTDVLGFMKKWVLMQEKFSDMLPMLPVYSNVYADFYTMDLQNYNILEYITWGGAIVAASYYDVSEFMPEDEDDMDLDGDDEDWDEEDEEDDGGEEVDFGFD